MTMQILAVAMQDVAAFGVDRMYVRHAPDKVELYDVYKDGRVVKVSKETLPEAMVSAAIEKFNASFRVVPPVEVKDTAELPKHLGTFEVVDDTTVRKKKGK
jgi:hypothetical protein